MSLINRRSIAYIFFSTLFLCNSCKQTSDEVENHTSGSTDTKDTTELIKRDSLPAEPSMKAEKIEVPGTLEKQLMAEGLVDVQSIDSTIEVTLKYATTDNFVGIVLYDSLKKAYLQPEVAERLHRSQRALQKIDSTLSLLIYDAVRPRSVQQKMWDALDSVPVRQRVKFVSNPKNGSIHNYGCAVDVTIVNTLSGRPLDMGAGFDDPRKIAYPRLEDKMLESGRLEKMHHMYRKLLRQVMKEGGFWVLPTEWWHFNAYSRAQAKEKYDPIE